MEDVWESNYLDAYDAVLLNSDIYLEVLNRHLKALSAGSRVLDSGAGTGNLTLALLEQGKTVYAVDKGKKPLDILKRKCGCHRATLHRLRLDACCLPFRDACFDGVNSMFTIHFVDDFFEYLREHYRVLEEKGLLMLSWRVSGENMEQVVSSYEGSLRRRGLYKALEKEMDMVREGIFGGVGPGVKHNLGPREVHDMLEKLGFRSVVRIPNPYFGQCFSVLARK